LTDVETNRILSYAVTDERTGDAGLLLPLVDQAVAAGHRLTKVLADGAYDSRSNWSGLQERHIQFVTNIRQNASIYFQGCSARGLAVRERNEIGDQEWKSRNGYGMRWKVESAISDLKRMFGDSVRSRDMKHMAKEVDMRISLFNQLKGI